MEANKAPLPPHDFVDVTRTQILQGPFATIAGDLRWLNGLSVQNSMMESSMGDLRARIRKSNRVQQAVSEVQVGGSMTAKQCIGCVESILGEMEPAVRPSIVYPVALAARPLCRNIYRGGINVNRNGIDKVVLGCRIGFPKCLMCCVLKVKDALKTGPVILLPVHRSHMDYIAIQLVTVANHLPVPFVIAGDNLNFPIIGRILRNAGAIFTRRSIGADSIYWAVFTEYIAEILKAGGLLECFIEGGRSRSGKSLQPRLGFLHVIVQLVKEGVIDDVTLFPVGIAYDRMAEGSSFVQEMLGIEKEKESLSSFIPAATTFLRRNLGSIDITISDQLVSLRSYLDTARHRIDENPSDRLKLISELSHLILYEANLVTTVTATSLVAAVLLTSRTRGIAKTSIIERVSALIDDLRARKVL